jgi:hypothetical protein
LVKKNFEKFSPKKRKSTVFLAPIDRDDNFWSSFSLIVKSNRPTLDMELTELSMDGGTIIWKKPKEVNSNKEN